MTAIERWLKANSENNIRRVLDDHNIVFKNVRRAVRSQFTDENGVIRSELVTTADVETAIESVLKARSEREFIHSKGAKGQKFNE